VTDSRVSSFAWCVALGQSACLSRDYALQKLPVLFGVEALGHPIKVRQMGGTDPACRRGESSVNIVPIVKYL